MAQYIWRAGKVAIAMVILAAAIFMVILWVMKGVGIAQNEVSPPAPTEVLGQADQAWQQNKDYGRAEQIYRDLVQSYQGQDVGFKAQRGLSLMYLDGDRQGEAQQAVNTLLEQYPSHPDLPGTICELANEYWCQYDIGEAQRLYGYLVTNRPESEENFRARFWLAAADIRLDHKSAASAKFDALIRDFPNHPDLPQVLFDRALQYARDKQDYFSARPLFQYIVEAFPSSPLQVAARGWVISADIFLNQGTTAEAELDVLIHDFANAPELAPVLVAVAGHYWAEVNDAARAKQWYQYVVDHYPGTNEAFWASVFIIRVDLPVNREMAPAELLAHFRENNAGHPELPAALSELGEDYRKQCNFTAAKWCYQEIMASQPADIWRLQSRAGIISTDIFLNNEAEVQKGLEALLRDFAGHPDLPFALYELANQYYLKKDYGRAQELYQIVLAHQPDQVTACQTRAQLIVTNVCLGNEVSGALEQLFRDFKSFAGLRTVLCQLGRQYLKTSHYPLALDVWNQLLTNFAVSEYTSEATFMLAMTYQQMQDYPAAAHLFLQYLNLYPTTPSAPMALNNLAVCQKGSGDLEGARAYLQRALAEFPQSPFAAEIRTQLTNLQGDGQ